MRNQSPDDDLANIFSDFFTKKTAAVRATIVNNGLSISDTIVMTVYVKFEGQLLTHLRPATPLPLITTVVNNYRLSLMFQIILKRHTVGYR